MPSAPYGGLHESRGLFLCLIAGVTCPRDVLIEGPGAPRVRERRGPSFSITALADGRALVAGGADAPSAETYDPVAGTWTLTGPMTEPRRGHSATLLHDGRVLVAGGSDSRTAELFDPATDTWSATGSMQDARRVHTAILLSDGRVLVAGGKGPDQGPESPGDRFPTLRSAELYDPTSGTWSVAPPMSRARVQAPGFADALGNAFVVAGGGYLDRSVERFDSVAAEWTQAAAIPDVPLEPYEVWGSVLQDGRFLLIDGWQRGELALLYEPAADRWDVLKVDGHGGTVGDSDVGTLPSIPLLLLADGRVLGSGGGAGASATDAWLFDPTTATWSPSGAMGTGRNHHGAVQLESGRVLVYGGEQWQLPDFPTPQRIVVTSELYDPTTGTWSPK